MARRLAQLAHLAALGMAVGLASVALAQYIERSVAKKAGQTRSGRATSFLRFRQAATAQLEFRILGRVLLHAALVGLAGYGAAQVAITGASWLPTGWRGAELLLLAGVVKLVATSLTVGTGGSAGDFGPSLVMGGLFGGAFGRALQGVLGDPTVDPGAFALVGMGTFYGGIAHVPVSSLVMVCELLEELGGQQHA